MLLPKESLIVSQGANPALKLLIVICALRQSLGAGWPGLCSVLKSVPQPVFDYHSPPMETFLDIFAQITSPHHEILILESLCICLCTMWPIGWPQIIIRSKIFLALPRTSLCPLGGDIISIEKAWFAWRTCRTWKTTWRPPNYKILVHLISILSGEGRRVNGNGRKEMKIRLPYFDLRT